MQETGKADQMYYIHTDHLGSYDMVTNSSAAVAETYAFDVWGYRRKNANWVSYETRTGFLFSRGFTGHEHYNGFDIINMNGRIYDPAIGRFFSPDPFVQASTSTQGFNRYSYCLNNPLMYTDPSGEWFGIDDAIVAGASFVMGYVSHGITTRDWGWNAVASGGMSALAGWLGYNTCGLSTTAWAPGQGITSATWNYMGSMAINSVASQIIPPMNIPITNNFSLSISPTFLLGNQGFDIGANLGFNYMADLGNGTYLNLGLDLGGSGRGYRVGGGFEIGGSDFSAGLYSSYFGGGNNNQRVGGASMRIGEVTMRYENDGPFFGWGPGDGGDRYRTAAAQIAWRDFSIGVNLYTGMPNEREGQRETTDGWIDKGLLSNKYCYVESSSPRLGALYVGYKNYQFGRNSEMIRHLIQNRAVHDNPLVKSPHFQWVDYNKTKMYFNYANRSRYSLW